MEFVKVNLKDDSLSKFKVNQDKYVCKIVNKLVGSNVMQKK